MKAIIVLVVLGALVLGAVYYFGNYASLDPSKQGRNAKAAIKPGMSWKKVVDTAGTPQKYQHIVKSSKKVAGSTIEDLRPGPPVQFDADAIAKRIASNAVPNGFVFTYRFSESVAFAVNFDSTGAVGSVNDVATMADLLDQR